MDTESACGVFGCAIPEGGVDPLPIVVAFEVSEQVATGLVACGPSLLVDEFDLERMKEALH